MTLTNDISVNPSISGTKPTKNLTFQDAIVAVAVYASQLAPNDCNEEIKKIQSLAQDHPLFNEDSEKTKARIYKFANYMGTQEAEELVSLAATSLTSDTKRIAFAWAVELSLDEECSLKKSQNMLDELRMRLAIDNYIADKMISQIISKRKS